MIIPGTTKAIIETLTNDYGLSIQTIAQFMGMAPKTLYRILNDKQASGVTNWVATQVFIKVKSIQASCLSPKEKELAMHEIKLACKPKRNSSSELILFRKSISHFTQQLVSAI